MEFIKKSRYKYGIITLFVLGIISRLWFYVQNPSLWFDEAGLAINFITKSYKELLGGLDYLQAAPAGFCILEKLILDIFRPTNDIIRDYLLRLIPCLSGILTLPAFFYLSKSIFKDRTKIILAFAIFSLNTHAILYCSQCKQYTTELLVSTVLIIIFNNLLNGKLKKYYPLIIAVSPWFSYSSFFILAAGFTALLIKNKKQFLNNLIPFLFSVIIYYFVSLKTVFSMNYTDMEEVWTGTFKAFMDFHHPLRLLIRFGELFMLTKLFAILSGLIIFYALIRLLFAPKDITYKILLTIPVILAILASLAHKYPIYSRLILFLLPAFSLAVAELSGKFHTIIKTIFMSVVIFSLLNHSIYAKEMAYSYAREVTGYLVKEIKPQESIIMDNDASEYYFYLEGKGITNRIYEMPVTCIKCNAERCREYIETLPDGKYYFFSSHDNVSEVTENYENMPLPFKPKYVKAVYFKKG